MSAETAIDSNIEVKPEIATCPICLSGDSWRNVDSFRMKPVGMHLCMGCGFISYPDKIRNKEALLEFYRREYRTPPTVQNIITGERKLQYHAAFLGELFDEWKEKKIDSPVVADIGSAFGLLLKWVRDIFPAADVEGVELTKSFVRVAWNCYKIRSREELDTSKKYDLITSYKSLEHIIDPHIELKKYIECLKDDGTLYLGIPIWFEALRNFGMTGFDVENYFSPNHVNTWTYKHIKGLIVASGGEIVKENRSYYDTVFLVKKRNPLEAVSTEYFEDPNEILSKLEKIKQVGDALTLGDYKKALEIWPNTPHAWSSFYEMNRRQFHEQGYEFIEKEVIEKAFNACPFEADVRIMAADIACRYEFFEKALEYLNEANQLRPNAANTIIMIANTYRLIAKYSKDPEVKIKCFQQSRKMAIALKELGIGNQNEALTWLFYDSAQIPTPFEGE